ncbi:hypothetical protein VSH64_10155 [Amycolatopsis rhabdoformis]|uniref:DUF4437 domain-containing protein n=1 Tax=Amycolatopsis rhabdoformis TaxID=1448059 RepID=A0ABZ1IEE7_9PSEU|nr:hypothetical protein [Amycolatopsis rhabdoformis]WSE32466.1 hypothetical protein VSH64_10155 [Amycolatopsis rhabdoformis]
MTTATTDHADPRRSLPVMAGMDRSRPIAAAQYFDFGAGPGTASEAGRTWTTRGQNAVVHYVAARAPGPIVDTRFASETALVLTSDAAAVTVTWDGAATDAAGHGIVVIPPGAVRIDNAGTGDVVLLVRADEPGWAERAANAEAYAEPHPRVAPAEPWPEPVGAPRVRVYPAADHPISPERFGRIYRTRSFMINLLPEQDGPRDPAKLSPHHHDDFEQYSLATGGTWVHHIRTPWLTDQAQWREDEHVRMGSPSLAVIPPPTIHTSAGTSAGRNVLIDIFSPPREDFSAKAGWVLNAEDYPR